MRSTHKAKTRQDDAIVTYVLFVPGTDGPSGSFGNAYDSTMLHQYAKNGTVHTNILDDKNVRLTKLAHATSISKLLFSSYVYRQYLRETALLRHRREQLGRHRSLIHRTRLEQIQTMQMHMPQAICGRNTRSSTWNTHESFPSLVHQDCVQIATSRLAQPFSI